MPQVRGLIEFFYQSSLESGDMPQTGRDMDRG
jgi:hypothetical protein